MFTLNIGGYLSSISNNKLDDVWPGGGEGGRASTGAEGSALDSELALRGLEFSWN